MAAMRRRFVFGAMEEVVFGRPASEAVVEQMDRLGASRAFLMVSGTLNRETDEIEKIRRALGARYAATFDAMPAHTPRSAPMKSWSPVSTSAISGRAMPGTSHGSMPATSRSATALAGSTDNSPGRGSQGLR